jgi:hypothetical protein
MARSVATLAPTPCSTHSLQALQTYGLLIRACKPSYTTKRYMQYGQNILKSGKNILFKINLWKKNLKESDL